MTIDERIEALVEASRQQQRALDKLTEIVMGTIDSIKRLERIAGTLLITDEELNRRLTELEQRGPRRPQ